MSRTVWSVILVFAMGLMGLVPSAAQAADSKPVLTVKDKRVSEPGSGQRRARFFLDLDRPAPAPMYVRYATVAGSAAEGSDFTARSGRVTFRRGERRRLVDVPILADSLDERRETFTLQLSAVSDRPASSRPVLRDRSARATIVDVDPAPLMSVYGVSGAENTESLRFRVRLSRATYREVTANFTTKTGTAGAQDFVARTGTVAVPAGSRDGFIDVRLRDDAIDESDERFSVTLSGPAGARLRKPSADGTIVDNEGVSGVSINDVSVAETAGTAELTVSRASAAGPAVKVSYATHSGTATQGVDFTQTTGDVTIPANAISAKITVPVAVDYLDEDAETFTVQIVQPVGGTIVDGTGVVTIVDNDLPPVVNVIGSSGLEGDANITSLFATLSLNKASGLPIKVTYQSADDTATVAGGDYQAVSGSVTFQPGETSKAVLIPVIGDVTPEPNEQLKVTITEATNATIGAASGNVIILNDD